MPRRRYGYYSEFYYEPTSPIETSEGIKARSRRGAFAKNWWASRWIQALERLVDAGRLTRGRRYARKGQVLSIKETKEGIEARVQGSRQSPYKITIQVTSLTGPQWEAVIDQLAEQALFSAQLLAGEMPQEIEDAFQVAGVSLFPGRRGDLQTHCSCPDWANPCKHVAATHYILGERFDEDPFLIFRLRGRTQEQILQALRQRRVDEGSPEADAEETEIIVPLEEILARETGAGDFWKLAGSLDNVSITIHEPGIEMPLLKRLEDPTFVPDPGLQSLLDPAYRAISQAALDVALKDRGKEDLKNERSLLE